MSEGIKYKKEISLERTNDSIIPAFLANIRIHPEFGKDYREIDQRNYRNKTVRYLENHGIGVEGGGEDDLEFKLKGRDGPPNQSDVDLANRIIILSNKILVTTRETDVRSKNFEGTEYNPQEYLYSILDTLDPLEGEDVIDYGTKISRIMSEDKERNLFPTLAVDGLETLREWYWTERDRVKEKDGGYSSMEELNERYKELLSQILDYSQETIRIHGHYALGDKGRERIGRELLEGIKRTIEEVKTSSNKHN